MYEIHNDRKTTEVAVIMTQMEEHQSLKEYAAEITTDEFETSQTKHRATTTESRTVTITRK